MVRHLRGLFERAAVSGDARRAKGVVADARGDAGGFGAPLNHLVGVRLGQGIAGEPAGRAAAFQIADAGDAINAPIFRY